MDKYYFFAVLGFIINAFAQLSLKKNALVTHGEKSFLKRNLTFYGILGYSLFVLVTLCSLYALKKVRIIDMVYLAPINYLLVIILSAVIFKEKITKTQLLAIFVVLLGIFIFNFDMLVSI